MNCVWVLRRTAPGSHTTLVIASGKLRVHLCLTHAYHVFPALNGRIPFPSSYSLWRAVNVRLCVAILHGAQRHGASSGSSRLTCCYASRLDWVSLRLAYTSLLHAAFNTGDKSKLLLDVLLSDCTHLPVLVLASRRLRSTYIRQRLLVYIFTSLSLHVLTVT